MSWIGRWRARRGERRLDHDACPVAGHRPTTERRVRVLQDVTLDAQLDREGYVVVPFLDPDALDQLTRLWERIRPDEPATRLYSTVLTNDAVVNHEVEACIRRLFEAPASALFEGCRLSGASLLIKGLGEGSVLLPHQDWNNVDERRSTSFTIWCPLVDTNATNGALEVLAGSHRMFDTVRGFGADSLHLAFGAELDPFLTRVDVPAGSAVVFAHNLFHGSRANNSGQERATAVAGVVVDGADRLAYWHPEGAPDEKWRVLRVHDDFYNTGVAALAEGRIPDGVADLGEIVVPPLDYDTVMARLRRFHRVS